MQITNETTWKESRLFGCRAKLYDRLNEQTLTEPKACWDLHRLVIGNVPQRQLGHFSTTHSSLFCLDCAENKQHLKDLRHRCWGQTTLADNSAVIDPVCLGLWFFFFFLIDSLVDYWSMNQVRGYCSGNKCVQHFHFIFDDNIFFNLTIRYKSHKISISENMLLKLKLKPLKQRGHSVGLRVVTIKNSTVI